MTAYSHTQSDYPCGSLADQGYANAASNLDQYVSNNVAVSDQADTFADGHHIGTAEKTRTGDINEDGALSPLLDLLEVWYHTDFL